MKAVNIHYKKKIFQKEKYIVIHKINIVLFNPKTFNNFCRAI